MDNLSREVVILKKLNILLLGILFLVLVLFSFVFLLAVRQIRIEEYCRRRTEEVVGSKWGVLFEATLEERRRFPGMSQISWSFREQLRCEREKRRAPLWF